MIRLKEVKEQLSQIDMTISYSYGEYRVNYKGGGEETAYYTDSLDDAFHTANCMAQEREERSNSPVTHYIYQEYMI